MPVSNEILTNRLDKKINYGVARTAYDGVKSPVQEAIGSPSPNPAHDLWIDSDAIPAAMPQTNTTDLLIYKYKSAASAGSAVGNSSGVIEMTLDTTVASGRSYLACSTLNDANTRLPGWVGFGMFGAQYLTKIVIATSGYHGQNFDLSSAAYYKVVQPGAVGYEFYFDVDAGVLVFAGTSGVPTELSSGRSIYLSSGARYRGRTGIKNYIDIVIASPAAGEVIKYDTGTSKWTNQTAGGGTLASMTDTNIPSPTNEQVLKYDTASSKWIAGTGGGGTLASLTDTNITNPANKQIIEYDIATSKWVNAAATTGGTSTLTEDIFTGDGTTVIFEVTDDVTSEANLLISVDGIIQPNSAWTLTNDASGDPKRVTLSGAPLTGQTIRMLNIGISSTQTMVPSTGSVTPEMISSTLKNYHDDEFTTVNASTVNFDCTADLLSTTSIIVTIDGVTQPSTAFSLSTDAGGVNQRRVVLSVAPETGANIRVLNLGLPSTAPLASGVVNATHLALDLKSFYDKTFTGDGTTVNYDMDNDVSAHGRDLLVTVDGIVQTETTHYTIGNDSNSNQRRVIFGTAPITGTAIRIMHLGIVTVSGTTLGIEDNATSVALTIDQYENITLEQNLTVAGSVTANSYEGISSSELRTATSQNLKGTYTETIMVADAYVLTGDVVLTGNFFTSKLTDDGNAVTITDDGNNRTITGTGTFIPCVMYDDTLAVATPAQPNITSIGTLTGLTVSGDVNLTSTDSVKVPTGTTAQRGTTATGAFRFNTTDTSFEGYDGTEWGAIGGGEVAYTKETFTATASQTTFTLANKYTLGYIDVYLNGVKLVSGDDFTATSTSAPYTVVLATGAALDDVIQTVAFNTFVVAENTIRTETFTATASQTTFTLVDPYTIGNIQVYLNGVKLLVGVDVTATNGTTVVLADPANVGDAVQTVAYGTFASSDHYLKSETYTKTEVGTNHYTKTEHLALPSNILPDAHNTRDLGSNAVRWANVYAADVHLKNERGDWSMVEEEDYLTLINNKTGKRFKLLMEELD